MMIRLFLSFCLLVTTCWGSPRYTSRILGGADADIADFPFAASIRFSDTGHYCCGVILSDVWILTDAYCTQNPAVIADFTVQVGSAVSGNGSTHSVTEWTFHPLANVFYNEYDFALVKVDPPFQINDNVAAVALPVLGQETPDGAVGVVAGWGQKDETPAAPDIQLQYANVTTFSDANCTVLLGTDYNERTLCGQGVNENVALCWHDEGAPLVVEGQLLGIALWPKAPCANPQYPIQKYGRVSSVRDWIDSIIGI